MDHYYHPAQRGSWSIKAVLPTIAPELDYGAIEGVRDGGMAMTAYMEATIPQASHNRRAELTSQLLAYCARDTEALCRVWTHLKNSPRRE